jgi:hypothetical protein
MRPNFSREGWVAGYLGQCPKFDRFFYDGFPNKMIGTKCNLLILQNQTVEMMTLQVLVPFITHVQNTFAAFT